MIQQFEITLPAFKRGFHLITELILKNIQNLPEMGMLNIFIKHTSAAITLNENFDSTVRSDFETFFNKLVPDATPYFVHDSEGADDMPAHIKSAVIGQSLTIPVSNKKLNLGTWQGIYLCEFRNNGGCRRIVITLYS